MKTRNKKLRETDFAKSTALGVSRLMLLAAIIAAGWFFDGAAVAQVRSGAAFLKILPGARQQGLAASLTGGIDEMHTLYANPAATGYLREWQWAVNYTEWFADAYNLSIAYGRKWRTPWSRDSKIAFGLYYQGIRDFESTGGLEPAASANDLLLTFSYGNPLTFLSRNLAVGGNLKFLRSRLANFTASSFVFDGGLLFRSNRLKLKTAVFDYAIVSAGVSATHLGQALDFIAEATPLPTTLRAGMALNFGKHGGLQLQLSGDYQKVEDENSRFSFGAEVGWGYTVAFRSGYNFSNNILSKFSMGLSFRLDDLHSPIKNVLPGRNHALRVDLATLENNDFFSSSYRGGVNYYPIAPENFELASELFESCAGNGNVKLSWEMAEDPDLFDAVHYALFLMREDSLELAKVIEKVQAREFDLGGHADPTLTIITDPAQFSINKKQRRMSHTLFAANQGNYFWTVMAEDSDGHVTFPKRIARFAAPAPSEPDLLITRIDFHLNQNEINNRGCQGEIALTISNYSKCAAREFAVNVYDSLSVDTRQLTFSNPDELEFSAPRRPISQQWVEELLPGEQQTLLVPWRREKGGADFIIAYIDEENRIRERDKTNNQKMQAIALPELDVKIFAAPNYVTAGDTVSYTLRIENRGAAVAQNFYLHNQIPNFLTLTDSSFSVAPDSVAEEYVSWRFPALQPGQVSKITYLATVDSAVSDMKSVSHIFTPCDALAINNSDSIVVKGVAYDLQLTKTANVDPLRPKIKFNLNDSTLTHNSLPQLDILGRALQSGALQNTFIEIEGHTDLQPFRGHTPAQSRQRNQILSEGRARAVKNYLIANYNIATERICDGGFGQQRPISRVHEENRRVEINILTQPISCTSPVDPNLIVPAVYQQAIISYKLTVQNFGPNPAHDITLIDILPSNVSVLAGSFNHTPESSVDATEVIRWQIPMLAGGEKLDIHFKVRVDSIPSSNDAYELKNVAHLNSKFDSNQNNNSDASSVYAIAGFAPRLSEANGHRIHVVEPGESLSLIAKRYYRSPAQWQTIFIANQLNDENLIYPGQKLLIPDKTFEIQAESRQLPFPKFRH